MATFINASKDLRFVSHGLPSPVAVKPGEQLQVPDDVGPEYACQPEIWASKAGRKTTSSVPTEG